MSRNLIPEICKKLNLEIGEKFKLDESCSGVFTYMFENERLVYYYDYDETHEIKPVHPYTFAMLISGYYKVVELPWKPKIYDTYWTFKAAHINVWRITDARWTNNPNDVAALKEGWVYKTCAEAQTALPDIAKEIGVKYEL